MRNWGRRFRLPAGSQPASRAVSPVTRARNVSFATIAARHQPLTTSPQPITPQPSTAAMLAWNRESCASQHTRLAASGPQRELTQLASARSKKPCPPRTTQTSSATTKRNPHQRPRDHRSLVNPAHFSTVSHTLQNAYKKLALFVQKASCAHAPGPASSTTILHPGPPRTGPHGGRARAVPAAHHSRRSRAEMRMALDSGERSKDGHDSAPNVAGSDIMAANEQAGPGRCCSHIRRVFQRGFPQHGTFRFKTVSKHHAPFPAIGVCGARLRAPRCRRRPMGFRGEWSENGDCH